MYKISAVGFVFLINRDEITKGLSVLKKVVPGGDTFMNLGLQKV